jgi:hypothetical protein
VHFKIRSNRQNHPTVHRPYKMNRKLWSLLAALILLGGGYVYRFTDWLVAPQIQIEVTTRPSGRGAPDAAVLPTLFMLDREYTLQSLLVTAISNVPPAAIAKPAWHLTSESKPQPQRGFAYGEPLKGYKSLVAPAALVPGGTYRIELRAGRNRGTREFKAIAPTAVATE